MEEKIRELENQLKFLKEELIAQMEMKMAQAEMIQNPKLKRIRKAHLAKSFQDLADLHARLVDQFQRIISEGV